MLKCLRIWLIFRQFSIYNFVTRKKKGMLRWQLLLITYFWKQKGVEDLY